MARRARIVIPGLPHYIQQSGYNDRPIFMDKKDGEIYRDILKNRCAAAGLLIISYCFLPHQIHLLAIPLRPDSLQKAIGDANRQYARHINQKLADKNASQNGEKPERLWADRFHSCPLQDKYTHHVVHLMEWTPVLVGEVKHPYQWHYSRARTRICRLDDDLITPHPLLDMVEWEKVDTKKPSYLQMDLIYSHISTGRPLGDAAFIADLEKRLGKTLRPKKRGRRKRLSLSAALKNAPANQFVKTV